MINHFIAGSLSLVIGLNCLAVQEPTKQVSDKQQIVRLKSTLDVSGVSIFHSDATRVELLLTSSSPLLNPISKLVLLQNKMSLQLLDISSGKIKRTFAGFQGLPILSPSAQRLMIINRQSASVWSVETGEKLCDLSNPPREFGEAKWSPDEKSIMLLKKEDGFKATLLDKQKTVAFVYDAQSGKPRFKLEIKSVFVRAKFSPDSQSILTTSEKEDAKLWNTLTGQLTATLHPTERSIHTGSAAMFSPDGRFVVVDSYWRGISLWDASTGELYAQLSRTHFGEDEYRFCGFSPDGKLLVLYREHMKGFAKIDSLIELRDTETREIKVVLKGRNMTDSVHQVEWTADGKTFVAVGGNNEYNGKIWDVKTGRLIATFPMIKKHSRIPFDFGFKDLDSLSTHPSLPILTIVNNNYVRLLNASTGELLQKLDNATHPVEWTADGQLLISKTKDGKTIQIWELVQSDL